MYTVQTENRTYTSLDEQGVENTMQTKYEVVMLDGVVQNVFNEYGNSVTKSSEVFEYYSQKLNKLI